MMKQFTLLLLSIAWVVGLVKGVWWLLNHHPDAFLEFTFKVGYGLGLTALVFAVWTVLLNIFHKDKP